MLGFPVHRAHVSANFLLLLLNLLVTLLVMTGANLSGVKDGLLLILVQMKVSLLLLLLLGILLMMMRMR